MTGTLHSLPAELMCSHCSSVRCLPAGGEKHCSVQHHLPRNHQQQPRHHQRHPLQEAQTRQQLLPRLPRLRRSVRRNFRDEFQRHAGNIRDCAQQRFSNQQCPAPAAATNHLVYFCDVYRG